VGAKLRIIQQTTAVLIKQKLYPGKHFCAFPWFFTLFIVSTPIYLSRIVRHITGHTVVDYINQMLLMEASWLLQTTDLSIAAIAERLHFADQSSFGRFFTRMKGIAPKAYRMERRR